MNKFRINLFGGGFQHAFSSSGWSMPKLMEWDNLGNSSVSVYVDEAMTSTPKKFKKNYAWLLESSVIRQPLIEWMKNNVKQLEDNFELIFTYDKSLLEISDKMRIVLPPAVPWINNRGIHKKNKLISMIVSNKKMCDGHKYRHEIMNKYKGQMDCFGEGHNKIADKEDGLNDYYFSIAMENGNYPNYFTQTLTDCFVTGTIPIYWGAPTIEEYFNDKGIIFLDENFKIEDLSPELYYSKMEYIQDNFERANNLPIAEDYIYENYIK